MTETDVLTRFVSKLPPNWKWRFAEPPAQLAAEWQRWVAAAQRAEQTSDLTFWAGHGPQDRAA